MTRAGWTSANSGPDYRAGGPVTITGFLNDRLDYDQSRAEKVLARKAERGWESEDDAWDDLGPMGVAEWLAMGSAERMLREVAAKRAILARYEHALAVQPALISFTRGQDDGYAQACRDAVADFAAVYCDHPDYDPAWRPE